MSQAQLAKIVSSSARCLYTEACAVSFVIWGLFPVQWSWVLAHPLPLRVFPVSLWQLQVLHEGLWTDFTVYVVLTLHVAEL